MNYQGNIVAWTAPAKSKRKKSSGEQVSLLASAMAVNSAECNIQDVLKAERKKFKQSKRGIVKNREQQKAKAAANKGGKALRGMGFNRGIDANKGEGFLVCETNTPVSQIVNERLEHGERPSFKRANLDLQVIPAKEKLEQGLRLNDHEMRLLSEAGIISRDDAKRKAHKRDESQFRKDNLRKPLDGQRKEEKREDKPQHLEVFLNNHGGNKELAGLVQFPIKVKAEYNQSTGMVYVLRSEFPTNNKGKFVYAFGESSFSIITKD